MKQSILWKYVLLIISLITFSFIIYFGVVSYLWDRSEKESNRVITMNCLLLHAANLLNSHYIKYRRYPDNETWESTLLSNGYPKKFGCGPQNFANGIVVDIYGAPLVYVYADSDHVKIYSTTLKEEFDMYFELVNGKVAIKEKK